MRHAGHSLRSVAPHVLVLAEWDLLLLCGWRFLAALGHRATRWPDAAFRLSLALTWTGQAFLYALNVVSNLSWGRNMTAHLLAAFAPTVWSGKEPFPVGPVGMAAFACGTLGLALAAAAWWRHGIGDALDAWRPQGTESKHAGAARPIRSLVLAGMAATLLATTTAWAIESRDNRFWKFELIASFFRPEGFAFEPTARRHATAERDAALRASYPRHVPTARRKHVVLIIVDSLRADRMQAYGYRRPTTPFLSALVASGQMKKVEAAFASCSESFCGIASTLASRAFRDLSARTFQLQDVLHDQGYRTWFLLSGNHRAWNGLPHVYHVSGSALFDGSQTRRYTMDDDRLVLEGLERVPPASADQPAFFYVHLMSPHYLGVQFEASHVFTDPDDRVDPGPDPYTILDRLNKPDRYDDKVLQADGVIRQIFDVLAAKRYLDDAVVVVTGDHGEGLGERHWAHGWHLYNEDIRIPMLIGEIHRAAGVPDAPPHPDLTFATQVDIAPTILDHLGLPIPASWEGESLLSPTPRRFTYHQTYFLPNRFAVLYRDGPSLFKFIATPDYGQEELFDLRRDLAEMHNLVPGRPALAALLRDKVRAYRAD